MWTRKLLKTRAKAILSISYWKAFLVSLVIAFVGGGSGSFNFSWNMGNDKSQDFSGFSSGGEIFPHVLLIVLFGLLIACLVMAFRIFLGYPLEVGGRRYFVQSAQREFDLNTLGYAFDKGKYFDILKSMLWRGFINFLWFLLLIVPGIVKAYAYSMVPYILADNPNIGYRRASDLSTKMTDGQKFDMFVLDLSFIGWYILGSLAFLIGVIFVMPYENATKAELYLVLRQDALDRGICTPGELRLN